MKKDIILGNGEYTLMRIEDSKTKMKGLGIAHSSRFKTFGGVGEEVDISHIKSLDREKDVVIHFSNILGIDAVIEELLLLKEDMS